MHPNYPPRPCKAASVVVVSNRERGREKAHRKQKCLFALDYYYHRTLMFGNLRWNLDDLITEMVSLHRIKTTDVLCYSKSHR